MRRARTLAAGAVGATVVAVGTVVVLTGRGTDETSAATQSTATTTIRRQDLVERESVEGTLGYSDARTVVNRLAGTVTWTPKVGAVVRPGQRLYEVDGAAVYLLDGASPAYRTLRSGLDGDDVRQFERNMRRLGLDPGRAMTVDGTWDAGTTAAAKRWQARKGVTQDGSIEKGRIVFQPGSRRVSEVTLSAGASASGGGGGGAGNSPASYTGAATGATVLVAATSDQDAAAGFSDIPATTTPRATQTTPAPAATTPAPTQTTTPAPTTTTPTPAPTTTTPAPTTTTPAPTTTTPAAPKAPPRERATTPTATSSAARSGGGGASGADAAGASGSDGASGGSDVSSELMTTTSTKRIVAVDLETTKQALAERGAVVVVELPDGTSVTGTIATVGKVAQKKATAQNEDPPATIKLVIKLRRTTGTGLDQAPVDVRLERRRAKDALTVPVTALLARAGGTFAVEVHEAGRRRVVAVRTGLYTDSYVEVAGAGLRPGLTVTNSGI